MHEIQQICFYCQHLDAFWHENHKFHEIKFSSSKFSSSQKFISLRTWKLIKKFLKMEDEGTQEIHSYIIDMFINIKFTLIENLGNIFKVNLIMTLKCFNFRENYFIVLEYLFFAPFTSNDLLKLFKYKRSHGLLWCDYGLQISSVIDTLSINLGCK